MSNIIPPLVSSSPPPMVAGEPEDLDEDEFGDFAAAGDFSFDGKCIFIVGLING